MNQMKSSQTTSAAIAVIVMVASLSGCTSGLPVVPRNPSPSYDPLLLSGQRLFGEVVSADEIADVDILAVSDEMAAYVDASVGDVRIAAAKFRRLFRSLSRDNYFRASYVANITHTAQETFDSRSGNCLSYTNMFIALSRQAGLDARFQIVKVPPSWDADSGYLIRYTHINVLMKNVRFDMSRGDDFAVDFNDVHPEPEYIQYEVSDEYATALLYGNKGVAELRVGNFRRAFAYLKKALQLTPENIDLWINLAALYSRQNDHPSAIEAYEVALQIKSSSKGAMSGLARSHQLLGHIELAEKYAKRVRRYREKNPFYHFAIAQAEYDNDQFDRALDSINTAIDLKRSNARFHFMKGLTLQRLGDTEAAQKSFRRAKRYGRYDDLEKRYGGQLTSSIDLGNY